MRGRGAGEKSAPCAINFTVDKEANSINTMCKRNSSADPPDSPEPFQKCLKRKSCVLHLRHGQDHVMKKLLQYVIFCFIIH